MYWTAGNAAAWETFWKHVRDAAAQDDLVPPPLSPPDALPRPWSQHWLDPELALSQSCSLPFRTVLRDRVRYVATFDFAIPECPAGFYRSVAVMRRGDTPERDALTLAINGPDSQSGWVAAEEWRHTVRGGTDWHRVIETGAHAASALTVADGQADIAFLDIVTWRLVHKDMYLAGRLEVVGDTRPTPGLPLITAQNRDPAPLRRALTAALTTTSPDARAAMGGLQGLVSLDPSAYLRLPIPAPPRTIVPF